MRRLFAGLAALALVFCITPFASAEGSVVVSTEPISLLPQPGTLSLYAAPLLGADCLVLECAGEWLLVDMGKENDAPAITALLDALGVTRVDIAFNTHPHTDHIGAMPQLANRYKIGAFYTAFPADYTGSSVRQRPVLAEMARLGIPVVTVQDGDTFTLGDAGVEVFRQNSADANASSAVLRVTFGDTAFLLTGDVNRLSQGRLAARHDLQADILKYPHHGQEALEPSFLAEIRPAYAIITNGYIKSRAAQDCMDSVGAGYAFTTWGVIVARSDGERVTVWQEVTPEGEHARESWLKWREGK